VNAAEGRGIPFRCVLLYAVAFFRKKLKLLRIISSFRIQEAREAGESTSRPTSELVGLASSFSSSAFG
jgi:hypothetical protein